MTGWSVGQKFINTEERLSIEKGKLRFLFMHKSDSTLHTHTRATKIIVPWKSIIDFNLETKFLIRVCMAFFFFLPNNCLSKKPSTSLIQRNGSWKWTFWTEMPPFRSQIMNTVNCSGIKVFLLSTSMKMIRLQFYLQILQEKNFLIIICAARKHVIFIFRFMEYLIRWIIGTYVTGVFFTDNLNQVVGFQFVWPTVKIMFSWPKKFHNYL